MINRGKRNSLAASSFVTRRWQKPTCYQRSPPATQLDVTESAGRFMRIWPCGLSSPVWRPISKSNSCASWIFRYSPTDCVPDVAKSGSIAPQTCPTFCVLPSGRAGHSSAMLAAIKTPCTEPDRVTVNSVGTPGAVPGFLFHRDEPRSGVAIRGFTNVPNWRD